MKKTQLISLTTYCAKSRAFSMQDILIETVQKEDFINHLHDEPITIPRMRYPDSGMKKKTILQKIHALLP